MNELEIDLGVTIVPKSDQLNADDLIAGAKTICIREMKQTDSETQPISIYFDGDNNKPYKPSKGMRRVLVQLWGTNGLNYVGRSLTLFRDETVKFSGAEVGGIVISHASHIDKATKVLSTVSRGKKKTLTILPIDYVAPTPIDPTKAINILNDSKTLVELTDKWKSLSKEEQANPKVLATATKLKGELK